jgi:DNA uptake protein ComE-like DNA-binding protein
MIFIIALGIIVILSGMLLVFARSMRTAALTSGNELSALKAQAVEQGAERWVLAQVDQNGTDTTTLTQTPAEALQVGGGYFWVLRFYPDSDQSFDFGITDESTKVNLNTAQADALMNIPGMTEDVADAIVAWRSPPGDDSGGQGAQSDYYESLPNPYDAKNSPYETVGELLLVKGITPDVLFGYDLNHNGVIDDAERAAGGVASTFSSGAQDSRGLFNYVTVYGAATTGGGGAKTTPASSSAAGGAAAGKGKASSGSGGSTGAGQSYMYSADIVAVSGDGRAFKRARIVVNGRQPPSRIIFRKDLTGLGWPLPPEIRTALRAGQPPPTGYGASSGGLGTALSP